MGSVPGSQKTTRQHVHCGYDSINESSYVTIGARGRRDDARMSGIWHDVSVPLRANTPRILCFIPPRTPIAATRVFV